MVYEGVAVVLHAVDSVVAPCFFFGHGILTVPAQQQIDGPRVKCRICIRRHHVGVLPGQVLVYGGHVKVRTGKVSLVLISRLEDIFGSAALSGHGVAHFAYAVIKIRVGTYLAEGIVELSAISFYFTGIQMVEVYIRRYVGIASPPRFGERVLAIEAAERRRIERLIRIHIPPALAIGIEIGFLEGILKISIYRTIVSRTGKVARQFADCCLELGVLETTEAVVITRRGLCQSRGRH